MCLSGSLIEAFFLCAQKRKKKDSQWYKEKSVHVNNVEEGWTYAKVKRIRERGEKKNRGSGFCPGIGDVVSFYFSRSGRARLLSQFNANEPVSSNYSN